MKYLFGLGGDPARPFKPSRLLPIVILLGLAPVEAHADLTIVSTTAASGTGRMVALKTSTTRARMSSLTNAPSSKYSRWPLAETQTAFYKGSKVRVESRNSLTICDADTGMGFHLDPAHKTYWLLSSENTLIHLVTDQFRVASTVVTMAPTGAVRVIAGHTAREYAYTMNGNLVLNPNFFDVFGSCTISSSEKTRLGVVQLTGSEWVTSFPSMPDEGNRSMLRSSEISRLMRGLRPLTDKLATIPGFPIAGHYSMTFQDNGSATNIKNQCMAEPTSANYSEATSIRESALPDSLFMIPSGYKRVQAPWMVASASSRLQHNHALPTQ